MKNFRKSVMFSAILTIIMCLSLLAGATFALFTSEAKVNIAVTSGKVDVSAIVDGELTLSHMEADATFTTGYKTVEGSLYSGTATLDESTQTISIDKMVPMDKIEFNIKVTNNSNVIIQYRTIIKCTEDDGLFNGLKVTIGDEEFNGETAKTEYETYNVNEGNKTVKVVIEMPEEASNVYQDKSCKIAYLVEAVQGNAKILRDPVEASVVVPALDTESKTTAQVEVKSIDKVSGTTTPQAQAIIPTGAKVAAGTTELVLKVSETSNSNPSNISVESDEKIETLEVQLEGLDTSNTAPVQVSFYVQAGLANFALYHSGTPMTAVASEDLVDENNEYYYDDSTGIVTMAVNTFSPFTYKYKEPASTIIYPTGVTAESFTEGTSAAYVDENGSVQYVADINAAIEANAKFIYVKEAVTTYVKLPSGTNRSVDLTHDITIYANGASFNHGEISINMSTAGKASNLTIAIYNAKNIKVWGLTPNDGVVQNISLVNCHNEGVDRTKASGQFFNLNGTTGKINITMNNCSASKVDCAVYCNADGNLLIENCNFSECAAAIKISHKGTGTRNVIISDSTFDGCGCTEEQRAAVSGAAYLVEDSSSIKCKTKGTMTVNLSNITITNVVGSDGIVLGESGYTGEITGKAEKVTVDGATWTFHLYNATVE